MYGEDVDACLRLQLAGWGLAVEPGARVMHVAQRNSRRNAQHLRWHLASLWRLWQSGVYRQYRRQMMNAPR
jgi:GT2 family glycosyltransferase